MAAAPRPEGATERDLNDTTTASQRKSLRVPLPLSVEIAGITYAASNWSIGGVAVVGMSAPPVAGTVVAARLGFPMRREADAIDVRLMARAHHDNLTGFSFQDLDKPCQRALRDYLEMAGADKPREGGGFFALAGTLMV